MRILDEGRITNAYGQEINFSNSIIIATTNAGHCTSTNRSGLIKSAGADSVALLSNYLNPAILNRFTEILSYADITRDMYREILRDMYKRESSIYNRFASVQIHTDLDEASLDLLTEQTYRTEFGGRPAKKAVRDFILQNADSMAMPLQTGQYAVNAQTS